MKQILKGWDTIRIIRLVFGVIAGGYALWVSDYLLLLLSGIFFLQAILNWSCCSASRCTTTGDKAVYKKFVEPYDFKKKIR